MFYFSALQSGRVRYEKCLMPRKKNKVKQLGMKEREMATPSLSKFESRIASAKQTIVDSKDMGIHWNIVCGHRSCAAPKHNAASKDEANRL
jgi:hypothetical protein